MKLNHIKIQSQEQIDGLIKKSRSTGIIGYPGAGKTTLAGRYVFPCLHTDHYLHLPHDDRPEAIKKDLDRLFPDSAYIVEGNEVTRLVKRGLHLDVIILVTGSSKMEPRLRGLQGRVDKFMNEYPGTVYIFNPRKSKETHESDTTEVRRASHASILGG